MRKGTKKDRDLVEALLRAAAARDPKAVRDLLARGVDPNARDDEGDTALHVLLSHSRGRVAMPSVRKEIEATSRVLLERGASLDVRNGARVTPFWCALEKKRWPFVDALLARGPDLRVRSNEGYTVLHEAAVGEHERVIAAALAAGVPVDARDRLGGTALYQAAFHGHLGVAKLLVAAGANPNARAMDGSTPLHKAAQQDHAVLVAFLLDRGGDPALRDRAGYDLRGYASLGHSGKTAALLKKRGGLVAGERKPARMSAARAKMITDFLLEGGYPSVSKLIRTGVLDVDAPLPDGRYPLHIVTEGPWPRMPKLVKILLRAGARLDVVDKKGFTPLQRARAHEFRRGQPSERFRRQVVAMLT